MQELSNRYIFIKMNVRQVVVLIRITLSETLKKCGLTRYELAKRTGIRYQIIDNYYKNTVVRYDSFVLDRICLALDCNIQDIITFENK